MLLCQYGCAGTVTNYYPVWYNDVNLNMRNRKPFLLCSSVLAVASLIIARDILNITIPGMAIASIITLFMVFFNRRNMYSFAYFLLPLSVGIPGYIFLLVGLIIFVKQSKLNISQILPFSILALLEITHTIGYNFDYNISGIFSFLSFLFLFFLMIFSDDRNIDRRVCMICYSMGSIFALGVVYLRIILDYGFLALVGGELRSGAGMGNYDTEQMMNHLMMNANCIAYYAIVLISIAFVFMNKHIVSRSLVFFMIGVGVVFGLLTFSRTWILLFTMIVLWYLYSNSNDIKSVLSFLIISVIILIVGLYSGLLDEVLNVFEYRMENDNVESAGGRLPLFKAYNELIFSDFRYMMFGTGATYYKQVCQLWNSVHNGTQQIFVSFGLVGIITYLVVVIRFAKKYIKFKIKKNLILFAPFIASLIFVQSIQFLNPYPLMFPFVAASCMIRINEDYYV